MAAIVAVIVGVLLLGVVGVLVAIAVPTYNQYLQRSKAAVTVAAMAPLKPEVADFHARQGRCPINGDTGFGRAESYAGAGLRSVRVGRFDNGHCGLEGILAAPGHDGIDGKALWLDYDPEAEVWTCSSEIDDKLLPRDCRG
ncbi:fimbrial protein [Xanthomonas sp. Kuri4-1]